LILTSTPWRQRLSCSGYDTGGLLEVVRRDDLEATLASGQA
jgi:hypothetical protein